jgi:hypothetical protein
MAASLVGSAKPSKLLLGTIPGGGTKPTREPGGKITSSDRAGAAWIASANIARTTNARAELKQVHIIACSLFAAAAG